MKLMGMDLGGSSARVVVCTPEGVVLGQGRAKGANPRSSVGDPAANIALAVEAAGHTDVAAVAVGAAGTGSARRDEIVAIITDGLVRGGVSLAPAVDTDMAIAFRSVAPSPTGRLLLAGTGAVAAAFEDWTMTSRADGLGWLLGDEGSGSWIGREVLRAVAADIDRRGPGTALTAHVLARYGLLFGVDTAQDLIRATDGTRPAEWAEFAPLVLQESGDPVASDIVDRAAEALLTTARAVGDGEVVLAGGLLAGGALRERVEQQLGGCSYAEFPVVGACAMAAEVAGAPLDRAALTADLSAP